MSHWHVLSRKLKLYPCHGFFFTPVSGFMAHLELERQLWPLGPRHVMFLASSALSGANRGSSFDETIFWTRMAIKSQGLKGHCSALQWTKLGWNLANWVHLTSMFVQMQELNASDERGISAVREKAHEFVYLSMNLNWGAIVHRRVNGDVAGQVKTFAQLSIGEFCRGVGGLDFSEVGGMWQDKLQNEMGCSHCSIVDMDGLVDAIQSWRLGSNCCFFMFFRFQDDMYTAFGRYTVLGTHQSFDSTGMPVFLFFLWCLGFVLWRGKNIGYSKSFTLKVENQQLAFEPLGGIEWVLN